MGLQELSALIGIDLTPDKSECIIFNTAISSILCQYWRNTDMFCITPNNIPKQPAFIIAATTRMIDTKFYFDIDATDPNFTDLEYIINAMESALINLQGITDIIIQGNRMLIIGSNQKVFSVTFFEISEQHNTEYNIPTKSWMFNVNLSAW